jgi:hypothetical protein
VISRLVVMTIATTVGLRAAPFVLLPALIGTLAVELPVAALFRVGRRGLLAVLFVNLVTNPLFNAVLFGLYGVEMLMRDAYLYRGRPVSRQLTALASSPVHWLTLAALEIAIVLVEWGLLVWALRRTAGRSRRLLALSLCMNATSAIIGVVISVVIAGRGL